MVPSVGSISIFGVQMLQFCSSIFGGELPIDRCLIAVSFVLPSSGFIGERLFVGNSPGETLPCQDVQFDFSHVEPTAVLGGVDDLQTPNQPARLLGRKGSVRRA